MSQDELLWKYAEGTCTPQESAKVEALLADNPALNQEVDAMRRIHVALKSLEPEQPSMRFVQNVMEALPKLYGRLSAEPLVNPLWKKVFAGALSATLALITWLGLSNPTTDSSLSKSFIDPALRAMQSVLGYLPSDVVIYTFMVLATLSILMALDKMLHPRKVKT